MSRQYQIAVVGTGGIAAVHAKDLAQLADRAVFVGDPAGPLVRPVGYLRVHLSRAVLDTEVDLPTGEALEFQ